MKLYPLQTIANAYYIAELENEKQPQFPSKKMPSNIRTVFLRLSAAERRMLFCDAINCDATVVAILESYSAQAIMDAARNDKKLAVKITGAPTENPQPAQKPAEPARINTPKRRIGGENIDWHNTAFRMPSPNEVASLAFWRYVAKRVPNTVISASQLAEHVFGQHQYISNNSSQSIIVVNQETAPDEPYGSPDYYAYINMFLSRFKSLCDAQSIKMPVFQIGNEPDGNGSSAPMLRSEHYATLLTVIARQILSIAPKAQIITAGFCSGNIDYVRNVFSRIPPDVRLAGIAVHSYGIGRVGSPFAQFGQLEPSVKLHRAAASGLPVWITEFGIGTLDESYYSRAVEYVRDFVADATALGCQSAVHFSWGNGQVPNYMGIVSGTAVVHSDLFAALQA